MQYISQKDEQDLIFAIENDFDFIAASFVRTALDVLDVRKILDSNGGKIHKNNIQNWKAMKELQNIEFDIKSFRRNYGCMRRHGLELWCRLKKYRYSKDDFKKKCMAAGKDGYYGDADA
jgi:hypothetical protein